jgi:phosphohistidine phosphatase SixA
MTMIAGWRLGLFSAVAVCCLAAANARTLSGPALIAQLQQGGYVLLMRHASSPSAVPAKSAADAANIHDERQLDEKGRRTARAMGRALKKLGIPIGAVLSSPTYRALETVRLADLGTAKTYSQLGDGGHSMQAGAVSGQAGWLRGKVSRRPASGTDTVIVTHMPNIVAAFGGLARGLTDGEALVFAPEKNGAPELVARVKIEDWPVLARGR